MSTTQNTASTDWFPEGYEIPTSSQGQYTKILKDQEVRIRILTKPVIGYEYFQIQSDGKKKPLRARLPFDKLINPATNNYTGDPEQQQEFWAMKVWNYNTEQVEIFQTTKKLIKTQILAYARDPEYGALSGYDIKIKRTGEEKLTTYTVMPSPPKALDPAIKEQADEIYVNIEALFEGKNPFEKSQSESISESLDGIFPPK